MKKISKILLAALLVALTVVFVIVGASAEEWSGKYTSNWYDSTATTLVIDCAEDLAAFAEAVRVGKNFSGKTVKLESDIVWSGENSENWDARKAPLRKWTPIGNSSRPFVGTFDGNGHTVSGLYHSSTGKNVGFFGATSGATVKDLHIENAYFRADSVIGSIVGSATNGLTISGCSSDAYIVSVNSVPSNHDIGGIVGIVNGGTSYAMTVEDCAFYGDITSDNGCNVAGIVGQIKGNPATVQRCFAKGTYAGYNRVAGILGRAYGSATISDCYAVCKLYTWGTPNIGGIIGGSRNGGTLTITNCYYDGEFYDAYSTTHGGFDRIPTRLGGTEFSGASALATMDKNSTYYTDSKDDNSYTEQGNQLPLESSVEKLGGLDIFLVLSKSFEKDAYGNVYLTTVSRKHECKDHYGAWIEDILGGQKRACTYCRNTETRDEAITVTGASVRVDGKAGVRIATQIKKTNLFRSLVPNGYYSSDNANFSFGTVIIPSEMLDGELTVDTAGCALIERGNVVSQDNRLLNYNAQFSVSADPVAAYNTKLTARSFVKYTENSETVYLYSDAVTFELSDIIKAAYEDQKTSAAEKKQLGAYVAIGALEEGFYNENADNVLIIEEAGVETFTTFASALESAGYTKHSNYEYSDNYFGVYYNDEYVVNFYYTPKSIGNYVEPNQDWYAYGPANKRTEDMARIAQTVKIADLDNVMRVIVEKKADVKLPALESENKYSALPGMKTTIAQPFPNDNYSHYGMGYVIQLIDGSYIIIDGGENEDDPRDSSSDTDADILYKYLVANKPANHSKPVIAAWVLTHRHNDHVEVIQGFVPKYKNNVVLEQVIFNFAAGVVGVPTETRDVNSFGKTYITSYMPQTKLVTAHTGYKFYIRNAELTVLYSIDDFAPNNLYTGFINNESIAFDVVIDGEQRLMFTGEVFIPGSRALVNMYGEDLKSDVIQLSHHGHYGATKELYTYIWPTAQDYSDGNRFVLWPIGNEEQRRNRLPLAENAYIINCLMSDVGSSYMSKIHSMCDLIFKSGKITDTVGSTETTTEVASSGAIGTWEVIELNKK